MATKVLYGSDGLYLQKLRRNPERKKFLPVTLPLWKRLTDIVLSLIALIVLSPLFLIIAIAIRIESKGKIFYTSQRVGCCYRIFNFYKFRSMYENADKHIPMLIDHNQYKVNEQTPVDLENALKQGSGKTVLLGDDRTVDEETYLRTKKQKEENAFFKMINDPRITKVGRILRNTSLDELPQFINVLKGNMSIVGNRPLPLYEAEKLTTDQWAERFLAPAGVTGLWQVTQRGGSNNMSPDERKGLDVLYARNYSFLGDLIIMIKTIPALLQHENV